MRLSPVVLVLGLATSSLTAPIWAQADGKARQANPTSVELVKQGEALLAQGKLVEADDALEAALIADPANDNAFVAMARVSIRQQLYGEAIRMTRKALTIDPNDREALLVQGEALVELGALPRARANLARLQELCGADCNQSQQLAARIEKGPMMAAAQKPATAKN